MKQVLCIAAFAAALASSACGHKPSPADIKEADYSKDMKESVLVFVKAAKENPKGAGNQAEVFVEKLQGYGQRPVGANKEVYEQLVQKCKEVVDLSRKSGDVRKKLDEMAALANKL